MPSEAFIMFVAPESASALIRRRAFAFAIPDSRKLLPE
jgi:hypothetical protein